MVTEEKERVSSKKRQLTCTSLHIPSTLPFLYSKSNIATPCSFLHPWTSPLPNEGLRFWPILHLCPGPVFPITLFSLTGLALFLLYRSEWYEKCSLLELTGDKNILSCTDKLKGTLEIKTHQSCSELIFKIGLYSQKCRAIIEHCWIFKALLTFLASGCTVIAQE